jgi:hypothetical protein
MDKEILLTTATLMDTYADTDAELRETMASHLAGSLAVTGNVTLEEYQKQRQEEQSNYRLLNRIVNLLPTADNKGGFTVPDAYTVRAVQRHALNSNQLEYDTSGAASYIIGSRQIVLPKKDKVPFTELLLWPANINHVSLSYDDKPIKYWPRTACVPTRHFQAFRTIESQNAGRQLAADELAKFGEDTASYNDGFEDDIDDEYTQTKLIVKRSSGLSWVDKSWRSNPTLPSTSPSFARRHVHMGAPKERWGYARKQFDGAIPEDVITDFRVLDNLIEIANDFGQGKAAAAVLRAAAA